MQTQITSSLIKKFTALAFFCFIMGNTAMSQQLCNAHFTHQPSGSVNGVHFISSPNASALTTYAWSFGDGGTSTDPNPVHTYSPGNYLACLVVTVPSSNGIILCTATFCDSIHVGPTTVNCNAHFTHINSINGVQFTNAVNPAGTTYSWTFGDGGSSINPNPHHLYAPGNYLACLSVTLVSLNGAVLCTSTFCDSVHVGPVAVNCNAHFTHQSTSAGEHFTSTTNPAGTIYAWTFGDGGTSTNPNPTHLYAPGHYQVCLTVTVMSSTTGNVFCTTTHCDSIHIANNNPPGCNANFSYHHLSSPFTYGFTNLSSPNATGYMWHFGDATTSYLTNPFHHYMAAGTYQVCVTMFDTIHHCSNTICKTLNASFAMAPLQSLNAEKLAEGNTDNLSVTVYPNPAADKATIHIENATSAMNFKLYDNTGKLVIEKNRLTNGDFELNNTEYAPGIYFYRITDENNSLVSGKLMIVK